MIGRWKLEGRTQTNHIKDTLTFPVNPNDDLFCQDLCVDVRVCVCGCVCFAAGLDKEITRATLQGSYKPV